MNNIVVQNSDDNYIFLKIGDSKYAFEASCVLEIIKIVELEYPEKLPAYIAGILEYNGSMINVIDLKSVLDVEKVTYGLNAHIIIMKVKNSTYGIMIDDVLDIKNVNKALFAPAPYSGGANFISAIYLDNGSNITIIDAYALEDWMKFFNQVDANFDRKESRLLPYDIKSKEILHARKMQLFEKSKGMHYKTLKEKDEYISFMLDNVMYCLEITHVGGFYTFSETKIIKVPCTPDFVVGLMNIKGDYITVIDLKRYLESGFTKITDKSTIIVLECEDLKIGILTDRISSTISIQSDELAKNKYSKTESAHQIIEYVKDDALYLVLNIQEILNNEKLYIG